MEFMKIRIKTDSLNINEEEFMILKRDLKKLLKIEPSEEIKKSAEKFSWSIDEKEIIITKSVINHYRVEFYHHDKQEGNKCYLGSIDYHPVEVK